MKEMEDIVLIEKVALKPGVKVGDNLHDGWTSVVVQINETDMLVCSSKSYTLCGMCPQEEECLVSERKDLF
jgi:hypothetical protein